MLRGELFSTDMVRAYLEGRKNHTARPIKPSVQDNVVQICDVDPLGYVSVQTTDRYLDGWQNRKAKHAPGDFIYCRETWRLYEKMMGSGESCHLEQLYAYKADEHNPNVAKCCEWYDNIKPVGGGCHQRFQTGSWRPSIHMPREAARLFFRVAGVEVMRLEDVTEEFAMEDGFLPSDGGLWSAKDNFKQFWLNACGSDAHWMWVYWTEPVTKEEAYANAQ